MSFNRLLLSLLLGAWSLTAQAFQLLPEQVAPNAWALVGEIGPRTAENHLLNNTLGFVVTDEGVVLIGSGASLAGARLIEQAVAGVTQQPIRWVIDIGAQDHHWLGNSYFADKGIEIIALARTVAAQKAHADDHMARLHRFDPEAAKSARPVYASRIIEKDHAKLDLGGTRIDLIWPGNGHFPGDAIAWLPEPRVVYTGDFVFLDRMLGIHPFTSVRSWQQAFERIAALDPKVVVPGHGHPGSLAKARRETGDYLNFLIEGVSRALADWKDLGETTDELGEAPQFRYLKFYDGWHRRNINRTYLELEAAQ